MTGLAEFAARRPSLRALRHRDYRLYATGHLVSLIGGWTQTVAQSWLMYRLSHSEWMLGLTLFATHFPVFLLAPLGGLAADRFPRRTLVLITQTVALLQALVLAGLTFSGAVTATHILVLASLLGAVQAFDMPARNTLFFHMVGREDLISAISLNSAMFNVSRVIGPSLAGVGVAAFGEAPCFLLNAGTFIGFIVCLLRMHIPSLPAAPPSSARAQLAEGFRYVWRNRELTVLLGISALLNIAFGPVMALGPAFAEGVYGKGAQGLGVLVSAMGCGALIGVFDLARRKSINELPGVMNFSAIGMTVGLLAFGAAPSFLLALGAIAVIGFSAVRHNVSGNSLVQSVAPDSFRGRVTALYTMVASGMVPIGSLTSGWFAEKYGPRAVIFGAAFLCLLGCGVYRVWLPGIRRWVQLQEETCAA